MCHLECPRETPWLKAPSLAIPGPQFGWERCLARPLGRPRPGTEILIAGVSITDLTAVETNAPHPGTFSPPLLGETAGQNAWKTHALRLLLSSAFGGEGRERRNDRSYTLPRGAYAFTQSPFIEVRLIAVAKLRKTLRLTLDCSPDWTQPQTCRFRINRTMITKGYFYSIKLLLLLT